MRRWNMVAVLVALALAACTASGSPSESPGMSAAAPAPASSAATSASATTGPTTSLTVESVDLADRSEADGNRVDLFRGCDLVTLQYRFSAQGATELLDAFEARPGDVLAPQGNAYDGPALPSQWNDAVAVVTNSKAGLESASCGPMAAASAAPDDTTSVFMASQRYLYLLAGVPDEFRGSCAPKTSDLPADTLAAIECPIADGPADLVGYYLMADADAYYFQRVAQEGLELDSGGCRPDRNPPGVPGEAVEMPGSQAVFEVRLACFVNDQGYANLRIVDRARDVYIGVLGNGSDITDLVHWSQGSPGPGCIGCSSIWLWGLPSAF